MRVSYDPSSPNNRNIQSMDVYLKEFPGGLWNGLATGSSHRIQTMNGKYNGRSRYIKADFRLITVGRWEDASISVYVQDYNDASVAYLKWTLTINRGRMPMAHFINTCAHRMGDVYTPRSCHLNYPLSRHNIGAAGQPACPSNFFFRTAL